MSNCRGEISGAGEQEPELQFSMGERGRDTPILNNFQSRWLFYRENTPFIPFSRMFGGSAAKVAYAPWNASGEKSFPLNSGFVGVGVTVAPNWLIFPHKVPDKKKSGENWWKRHFLAPQALTILRNFCILVINTPMLWKPEIHTFRKIWIS